MVADGEGEEVPSSSPVLKSLLRLAPSSVYCSILLPSPSSLLLPPRNAIHGKGGWPDLEERRGTTDDKDVMVLASGLFKACIPRMEGSNSAVDLAGFLLLE